LREKPATSVIQGKLFEERKAKKVPGKNFGEKGGGDDFTTATGKERIEKKVKKKVNWSGERNLRKGEWETTQDRGGFEKTQQHKTWRKREISAGKGSLKIL